MESRQVNKVKALDFITAGNAIFTLLSEKTGNRYTYKVTMDDKNANLLWVKLLCGSDNVNDYRPLCRIEIQNGFPYIHKGRSTNPAFDTPFQAFKYVFNMLLIEAEIPGVSIFHAGRCCRCGRLLTVPESIESGIGPECAGRSRKINL